MKNNIQKIKKYEIWGAVFSIIIGSLFHFVFAWSGQIKTVALFAAVNESTWEHLKLAFWPTLFFSIIEWFSFGKTTKNFYLANAIKLISAPIIIVTLFYGWLIFFGDSLIWDISIFIISIIISYWFSFLIIKQKKYFGFKTLSVLIILIMIILFSTLTYFAPKNFLFLDPVNNNYGIIKNK